jgi:hypothetical protein
MAEIGLSSEAVPMADPKKRSFIDPKTGEKTESTALARCAQYLAWGLAWTSCVLCFLGFYFIDSGHHLTDLQHVALWLTLVFVFLAVFPRGLPGPGATHVWRDPYQTYAPPIARVHNVIAR